MKHGIFSLESSVSPTFSILPKLYELWDLVTEIHKKLCNKRALSTGGPCTFEYVTLLQSFHRYLLSMHWYIA